MRCKGLMTIHAHDHTSQMRTVELDARDPASGQTED